MKKEKILLAMACMMIVGCAGKTPGQKLDKNIDSAQQAVKNVEEKYEKNKEIAQKKADKAREDLANKIKP